MRWRILFFSLLLISGSWKTFAQAYTQADSLRIYGLLERADESDLAGNLTQALQFAAEALEFSRKTKMLRGEGFARLKMADLRLKAEGGKDLLSLYDEPLRIGALLKDSFLLGLSFHQLGQFFKDQAQYDEAVAAYNKALACYYAISDNNYVAVVYNDIGFVHDRKGDYERAVQMYIHARKLFEAIGNKKETANTIGNLAISNYRLGKKDEAIQLFKNSALIRKEAGDIKGLTATYGNLVTAYASVAQYDSAYHYQQLAINYAEKSGVKNTLAQAYANASSLLLRQDNAAEALTYEQKAIRLYTEMGDRVKLGARYLSMASILDQLNDSLQAEIYYQKASSLANELRNKPLFQSIHSARSAFYNKHGNHKAAFDQYKLYVAYKDSLLNEKTTTNIAELQTKYETEKKDLEIAKLETEQKIRQLELEKQQAIIAGNQLEAERREGRIQLLQQQQQLREVQLQAQKEELEKQVLLNKNSEQQLLLSVQQLQISENDKKLRMRQLERERLLRNGIIAGVLVLVVLGSLLFNRFQLRKKIQEQERLLAVRNKISKDLHDEIGSTLTSIHILSKVSATAMDQDPQQARQMLGNISQQSKAIQQNMSDIVWAIRPDNDRIENLAARMREYLAQTLEPLSIQTRLEVNEEVLNQSLSMEHRKEVLLIFKEAVSNIVKHAGATEVRVQLDVQQGSLYMTIRDNGRWKGSATSSGTGTYSMQQRAAGLHGTVEIEGNKEGTSVQLQLPLP
ncbi:MAG TPA: tetratricopeptide repeat protein [Lacibacter sp.]|nr:tetratricopeptide repeat protein [Lacibacter sp.]HMO88544.1 tetratricopeptide repeat protein [Lacibacter sp.]